MDFLHGGRFDIFFDSELNLSTKDLEWTKESVFTADENVQFADEVLPAVLNEAIPPEVKWRESLNVNVPSTWDIMPEGIKYTEVPILTQSNCFANQNQVTECIQVLSFIFKSIVGNETFFSCEEILQKVAHSTNYEVVSVKRIQNLTRWGMHQDFAKRYEIKETPERLFHGTSHANARDVAQMGFRNAASRRAKYGKGIYSTKSIWEALIYADPDKEWNQHFFVLDLLKGPSCVGYEHMTNFGYDDRGKQIITATDPVGNIHCAAYEDQLYAHYWVEVKYITKNSYTTSVKQAVPFYHLAIRNLINAQISNVAPVVPQASQSGYAFLGAHMGFNTGQRVKYTKPATVYSRFQNEVGVITKIFNDTKQTWFFLELENLNMRNEVKKINTRPWYYWNGDQSWLRCTYDQMEYEIGSSRQKILFQQYNVGLKVGDYVTVKYLGKRYTGFNDTRGYIKQILKRGNGHIEFFVELDSADLRKMVYEINKVPWYDCKLNQSWLRCHSMQVWAVATNSVSTGSGAVGDSSSSLKVSAQPQESGNKRKAPG